jgi:hypothetical protein
MPCHHLLESDYFLQRFTQINADHTPKTSVQALTY